MRARTGSNNSSSSTTDAEDQGVHSIQGSNAVAAIGPQQIRAIVGRRERTTLPSGCEDDVEQMLLVTTSTVSSTDSSSPPGGATSPSRLRRAAVAATSVLNLDSTTIDNDNKPTNRKQAQPPQYRSWTRRGVVDGIQSIRIKNGSIPLITGLDRVIMGGASCAEAVRIAGVQPPRYLWYMLSGSGCDVLQFATLYALKTLVHLQDASMIWCLGFLLNIPCRHTSHRYLVFGDYVGGYWRSLARMYAGYSVIIILSTLFNLVMSRLFADSIAMPMLWLTTMLWTGVVNYFILKRLWSFGGSPPSDKEQTSQLP